MNIAAVTWPINDVGGINSWSENFISGARKVGHRIQTFYCTASKKFKCDPNKKIRRGQEYSTLPAKHISYHPDMLKDAIETLNQFDVIIFLHTSPHPTKAQKSYPWYKDWMAIYNQSKPIKLVVFHDAWWERNNTWFFEVADSLNRIIIAQQFFKPSVDRYPSDCEKLIVPFPMDLEQAEHFRQNKKENTCYLGTQWLGIKYHEKFLPQLPKVEIPVKLYGCGIKYFYLRRDGELDKVIHYDHMQERLLNSDSIHDYFGFVDYEIALEAMSKCKMSIDLSYKGQINMTHWEPMLLGVISLVEERAFNDERCLIPEDCCFTYDLPCAASAINAVSKMSELELAPINEQAWKFVQRFDSKKVVTSILENL